MQYNGHLPIKKQIHAHEHMFNNTQKTWMHTWIKKCSETDGPTSAICEKAVQRAGWRYRDSPQALAAKSCLGHLALTLCLFDRVSD